MRIRSSGTWATRLAGNFCSHNEAGCLAIKDAHKRAGHRDTTTKMHRLWIVLNSLEKHSVKRPRRLGATVQMLKWLGAQLAAGAESIGELKVDCRMIQAAWFFMLRAREFADSSGVDEEMVVRGQDSVIKRHWRSRTCYRRQPKPWAYLPRGSNRIRSGLGVPRLCIKPRARSKLSRGREGGRLRRFSATSMTPETCWRAWQRRWPRSTSTCATRSGKLRLCPEGSEVGWWPRP